MQLKKIDALGKPYRIYAEVLEPTAIEQFIDVMSRPDVVQGALMPDAHAGYVMPIGGVVATEGTVYPSFVGYDIGCGMCAVRLDLDPYTLLTHAEDIRDQIYQHLPVGFSKNSPEQAREADGQKIGAPHSGKLQHIIDQGSLTLGTLGGGNHFVELGVDEEDHCWMVIHSGSRSLGYAIGSHYMAKAGEGNPLYDNTDLGREYIADMNYALLWAIRNRALIKARVLQALTKVVGNVGVTLPVINRNHNHAVLKGGRWIHRKGATDADMGVMGVIPGNMRDGSFIVMGLGNPDSLCSYSHGAGRVMSRSRAKKLITFEAFQDAMKGIPGATVRESTIDEAPMAYKNIFEVMELQKSLVKVLQYIKPIVNVKG